MSCACFCISATLLLFVGLGFVSPLLAVPNAAVLAETAATATIQIRVDSPRPGEVGFDPPFATDGLSGRELGVGLERIRERNKELILLIERARIQRFRDPQRKALEIEIKEE